VGAIIHWNNFPRSVIESASLDFFRMRLGRMLDRLSFLSHERLDQMFVEVSFQRGLFCDSVMSV